VPVNDFSRTVELLISNEEFLETEIMKINALNPSVQRIILEADRLLKKNQYIKVNSELERALRLTKNEGALYLRIAHLRFKQGLLQESESFASRGLLLSNISSWERLLLNVYLKN
jgi:tetratricopeptide (TPR) repeat protein